MEIKCTMKGKNATKWMQEGITLDIIVYSIKTFMGE